MSVDLAEVERELDRVVDRLTSMPLARAAASTPDVERAAATLLALTRAIHPDVPANAALPHLAPSGLGAMIGVLGHDWLRAAAADPEADADAVLDALVDLRRRLP